MYLEIIGLCIYLCPMNFDLYMSHIKLVCQTQKKYHDLTIFQLYVFIWHVFNFLVLVRCNNKSIEHYKLSFTVIGSFWIWKAKQSKLFFSWLLRINRFQVHFYYWGQLLFREVEICWNLFKVSYWLFSTF